MVGVWLSCQNEQRQEGVEAHINHDSGSYQICYRFVYCLYRSWDFVTPIHSVFSKYTHIYRETFPYYVTDVKMYD